MWGSLKKAFRFTENAKGINGFTPKIIEFEYAEKILREYGKLVNKDKNTNELACIFDAKTLPYPKDLIKSAIYSYMNLLLKDNDNKKDVIKTFESIYTSLAHYRIDCHRDAVTLLDLIEIDRKSLIKEFRDNIIKKRET